MVTTDNVITKNNDNKQPETTNNLGERKTSLQTRLTGQCLEYDYFQLREFVGTDGIHQWFQSFHAFSQQEVWTLYVARNIATKQTIAKFELWDDSYDADKEFLWQLHAQKWLQAHNHTTSRLLSHVQVRSYVLHTLFSKFFCASLHI